MKTSTLNQLEKFVQQMEARDKADAANWKRIPGFEHHEINREGTVRSKRRAVKDTMGGKCTPTRPRIRWVGGKDLPTHLVNGYRAVSIKVGGKVKKVYVDSMVQALFPAPS